MFGTKNPTENHMPCEVKDCNNYFNVKYKYANGYCRLCNEKKKSEENTSRDKDVYKSWKQSLVDGFKLYGASNGDKNEV
tara:strand:+ start:1106 stop:1342 length:237 start_codon:yes stop_codon:yes gene_type:complete